MLDLVVLKEVFLPPISQVAPILANAILFLENHLTVPGLFRESPSKDELDAMRQRLLQGDPAPPNANPHVVAAVLKSHFRLRPQPIIPIPLQSSLFSAPLLSDAKRREDMMRSLVKSLPIDSQLELTCLFSLLAKVFLF